MLNRVVLTGRLTRDPELRVSQSDISVVNMNIAVNRTFTDKNGERGADFINVICFKKIAENVNQYLSKGSLCGIDGRLQTRNYENKEGQRIYVTEVVAENVQFLESKNQNNNQQNNNQQSNQKDQAFGNNSNASYSNSKTQNVSNGTNTQYRQNNQPQSNFSNPNSKQEQNPFGNDGAVNVNEDDLPF